MSRTEDKEEEQSLFYSVALYTPVAGIYKYASIVLDAILQGKVVRKRKEKTCG